jgi:hypothetical protein
MAAESGTRRGGAAGGAPAGALAGALMMLALMAWSGSRGQGFWTPLELVGGALLGVQSVLGGFWAGIQGLALHLATAAFWGMLFAGVVGLETTPAHGVWAGLLYGVAVWATMTWVALPVLDPTLAARVGLMEGAWFAAHLVYGAALSIALGLRRRFSEQRAREERPAVLPESEGLTL